MGISGSKYLTKSYTLSLCRDIIKNLNLHELYLLKICLSDYDKSHFIRTKFRAKELVIIWWHNHWDSVWEKKFYE